MTRDARVTSHVTRDACTCTAKPRPTRHGAAATAPQAAETKPADAVALLAALARLGARPSGAWVDEALAVVEPGLPDLSPAQFVALVGSLDALRHEPDEIWVASAFGALAHSAKKADAEALQTLKVGAGA